MKILEILTESRETPIPPELDFLAKRIQGKSWAAAKRAVVAMVGSIQPYDRFDDDVADAVFLRIQRNAQVGRYASEDYIRDLGRKAERLSGPGKITLFRAAPRGTGIRPGDFAAGTKEEAGHYLHGGHVIQKAVVPREDVIAVAGSLGGDQEYIYLPRGYMPPEPQEYFRTFREFCDAVNA